MKKTKLKNIAFTLKAKKIITRPYTVFEDKECTDSVSVTVECSRISARCLALSIQNLLDREYNE